MPAVSFNIVIVLIWCYIGCVSPSIYFAGNFIFYLLLYWFTSFYFQYSISKYFDIPFIYILLLCNDFVIRRYGAGEHDQIGKALCDITFIISFLCVTGSMVLYYYISSNALNKKDNNIKFEWIKYIKNVLLVLFYASVFFIFFVVFCMESFVF